MIRKIPIVLLIFIIFSSCLNSNEAQTNAIEEPDVSTEGIPDYLSDAWLCLEAKEVDDMDTEENDKWKCQVDLSIKNGNLLIKSTGIPNHDFESGLGCCAEEGDYTWIIPSRPAIADELTWAPDRGPIAITVTGVAIFGPEEGPGGDAVALHFEYFEEDRQPIQIGVCGGHSAGSFFHYHFDANCIHWHEENPNISMTEWKDYDRDKLDSKIHSPILGFAFDGFPIYGPFGWNYDKDVVEIKSSYRLKEGEDGYNGIDSWEYIEGLGDLDECNGRFSPTPEVPEGIYHYHSTQLNGEGIIGFPYFLLCYKGIVEESNFNNMPDAQGGAGPPGRNGPPGGGMPKDRYSCVIDSNGYCIFTGNPHQELLSPGTNKILDRKGNFLFSIEDAVATNSSNEILNARGRPSMEGDRLIKSSKVYMTEDEIAFHRVMATMYPIRNALMYDISELNIEKWNLMTQELKIRKIKDSTFTGGATPRDNYFGRQGIFDLVKNPKGRDIHHDVMKFLEESSIYLLCHVTSDNFNKILKDTHPEGHDPCKDAILGSKIPFKPLLPD